MANYAQRLVKATLGDQQLVITSASAHFNSPEPTYFDLVKSGGVLVTFDVLLSNNEIDTFVAGTPIEVRYNPK